MQNTPKVNDSPMADQNQAEVVKSREPISLRNRELLEAHGHNAELFAELFAPSIKTEDTKSEQFKEFSRALVGEEIAEASRSQSEKAKKQGRIFLPQSELSSAEGKVQELWQNFIEFRLKWHGPGVRLELIEDLRKIEPTFAQKFFVESQLKQASKMLDGKTAPIEFMRLPGEYQAEGRATVNVGKGEPCIEMGLSPAAADQLLIPLEFRNMARTLVHEEIHIRCGKGEEGGLFDGTAHSRELAAVCMDIIITMAFFHAHKEAKLLALEPESQRAEFAYDHRKHPTGAIIKLGDISMNADWMYSEALQRGLFEENGVDRYLELLDRPETIAFFSRLLWGSARPPELSSGQSKSD